MSLGGTGGASGLHQIGQYEAKFVVTDEKDSQYPLTYFPNSEVIEVSF